MAHPVRRRGASFGTISRQNTRAGDDIGGPKK